ncbi:LuxR C-terminal-related transcriptional regulator [Deinococcus deserti]|uniref:Putative Transcriptional regulator, LuxR family n=1 Tax=Deinococcus deserti (strain DSM 17065 / CIP 109153 / LMG 22923 / VCD115) TaxID=546414 RepID=C1CZS0_DEIDV|nr:LuxR C-terminal-related transcriptional regulator [Deinococcus deserti]ACO45172.1 putative Transcriptional regulator, LuxR family [Deinococcus deserti VCD115]
MNAPRSPQATSRLPPRPNPLLGREDILLTASRILSDRRIRLLTLRGPGGIGKTRLALDLAYRLSPEFERGAVWVNLAELREPSEVVPAVAQALGVPAGDRADLIAQLGPQSVLVVLDNFEHLAPAASDVAALTAGAPNLRILVTSRTALHVRGEQELPVGPLPLPALREPGLASPAVRLFVACAQTVDPLFQLTTINEPAVRRICELLEGIPLALELAAARLRAVTPQGLLEWLERPLEVLSDGPRDGPHHGHSLSSTIGWSVDLLTPEQREVFAVCGAFIGGFTLPALEAVTEKASARQALIGLVEHSLVQPAEGPQPRWRLLEPVREYAADLFGTLNEAEGLRERHARYYLALAEQAKRRGEHLAPECFSRLAPDDANLNAALKWFVEAGRTAQALRLVRALGPYWGHEATQKHHGWLRQIVTMTDAADEPALLADALCALGQTSMSLQQLDQARQALGNAGELYRRLGNASGEADVLLILASVTSRAGDHLEALKLFVRVQALYEQLGEPLALRTAVNNMGVVHLRLGQLPEASRCFERAQALSEEYGGGEGAAFALGLRSWVAYLQGQQDTALPLAQVAWQHMLKVPNALLRYVLLHQMAFHARDAGQLSLAARMVGCSEAMRASTGEPWDVCFAPHVRRLDTALRTAMGERYEVCRQEGSALRLEDLVPDVAAMLENAVQTTYAETRVTPLTGREQDVLRLLAQGISDKRIAQQLNISAATVSKHVSSMLSKLGVHNRVELARWALRNGLAESSSSS